MVVGSYRDKCIPECLGLNSQVYFLQKTNNMLCLLCKVCVISRSKEINHKFFK